VWITEQYPAVDLAARQRQWTAQFSVDATGEPGCRHDGCIAPDADADSQADGRAARVRDAGAGAQAGRLITGRRRDALALVLDAVDAVLEDGVPPPDRTQPDASLRTCALEIAFAEAEAVVSRLRASGMVPAPMTRADADQLTAAAASICVWGRIPGRPHPVLDHLADAIADVPTPATPLAQLA